MSAAARFNRGLVPDLPQRGDETEFWCKDCNCQLRGTPEWTGQFSEVVACPHPDLCEHTNTPKPPAPCEAHAYRWPD